jgi:hypothetical protein
VLKGPGWDDSGHYPILSISPLHAEILLIDRHGDPWIRMSKQLLRDLDVNPTLLKQGAQRAQECVEARPWNIEAYLAGFCIDAINNCVAGASSS